MASKALVPFVGSISTFDLEGEPLTANRALITACTEKEVKAMMETPLSILPAPGKEALSGARQGLADPRRWPLGPPFGATVLQVVQHLER